MSFPKFSSFIPSHLLGTIVRAGTIVSHNTFNWMADFMARCLSKLSTGLKGVVKPLKYSSTVFAIAGGILLAANLPASRFGFILLALSSGQLLLASWAGGDRTTALYAAALFTCVDCLGIYRWLLQ